MSAGHDDADLYHERVALDEQQARAAERLARAARPADCCQVPASTLRCTRDADGRC